jgi:hypothetical protein
MAPKEGAFGISTMVPRSMAADNPKSRPKLLA